MSHFGIFETKREFNLSLFFFNPMAKEFLLYKYFHLL